MAWTKLNHKINLPFVGLIILFNFQLSASEPSNQPLVLVLDNHGHLKSANPTPRIHQDTEETLGLSLLLKQLSKIADISKSSNENHDSIHRDHDHHKVDQGNSFRNWQERYWNGVHWHTSHENDRDQHAKIDFSDGPHKHNRDDRDTKEVTHSIGDLDHRSVIDKKNITNKDRKGQHSPVVKNLLRISNGLRCGAKNECENECNDYSGDKKSECEEKCERDITCEDDYGDNDCESSEDGCNPSTQSERYVTVASKCKRC